MIERINAVGRRSSRSTCPRASTRRRARSPAPPCGPRSPSRSTAGRSGSHVAPGRFHAGEVVVADIGLDAGRDRAPARHRRRSSRLVPLRGAGDTKYTAGAVLVVGGAPGHDRARLPRRRGGVPRRRRLRHRRRAAGVAAGRRGAPARAGQAAQLGDGDRTTSAAAKARAVALGPGLGRSDEAQRARCARCSRGSRCRSSSTPTRSSGWSRATRGRRRCSRRTRASSPGCSARARPGWARTGSRRCVGAAERFGCVVLLKGADTIVAAPGEGVSSRSRRRPSLATAGTGDVLTGVVAAFLAKGARAAARRRGRGAVARRSRRRERRTRPASSQAT